MALIPGILIASATLAPAPPAELEVVWGAPAHYVAGEAYQVQVELRVPDAGASVPVWLLGPSGFSVNGEPLAARTLSAAVPLAGGMTLAFDLDLGPLLEAPAQARLASATAGEDVELALGFDAHDGVAARQVMVLPARGDQDFMAMPAEELAHFRVRIITPRGSMVAELWPDVAPEHVRNFLDLSNSGFYDGSSFHRVIPGFMIQGGQSGKRERAPRKLKAEFNERKHVPGVLSMARLGNDENSADSEFFIMHKTSPHLDGKYSAFGQLVAGLEIVDQIVNVPRGRGDRPKKTERIERVVVYRVDGE